MRASTVSEPTPLVLINAVGLTTRLLAHAPRLRRLAEAGWRRSLVEVVPAVTCSAQATFLTGLEPQGHGGVGNGWVFRETGEVRVWQQSNAAVQARAPYVDARKRGPPPGRARPAAPPLLGVHHAGDAAA